LLAIFVFYLYNLSKVRILKDEGAAGAEKSRIPKYLAWAAVGTAGVVAASYFLVSSGTYIATSVGVPGVVIGSTIVAFGTSIPELATSISAVRKGHMNLALGNIVGSCFINITLILGVILVASPLSVNIAAFSRLAIFSLITNLFLWYFISSSRLGWREGAVFIFIYAVFLVTSFAP
jgi:cation:H+ antiporter